MVLIKIKIKFGNGLNGLINKREKKVMLKNYY